MSELQVDPSIAEAIDHAIAAGGLRALAASGEVQSPTSMLLTADLHTAHAINLLRIFSANIRGGILRGGPLGWWKATGQ